jgi:hypothetical protein
MRLPQVSFSMTILEAVTSFGGIELGAARFHTLVIGLHVVGVEHGCGYLCWNMTCW